MISPVRLALGPWMRKDVTFPFIRITTSVLTKATLRWGNTKTFSEGIGTIRISDLVVSSALGFGRSRWEHRIALPTSPPGIPAASR